MACLDNYFLSISTLSPPFDYTAAMEPFNAHPLANTETTLDTFDGACEHLIETTTPRALALTRSTRIRNNALQHATPEGAGTAGNPVA
jgi:hypothetical protein